MNTNLLNNTIANEFPDDVYVSDLDLFEPQEEQPHELDDETWAEVKRMTEMYD